VNLTWARHCSDKRAPVEQTQSELDPGEITADISGFMAIVSILLAVVAFVCTLIGFLTTPIPVLGVVFSFGAAAIALAGMLVGGRAISAAKQRGMPSDSGRIAVVLNVLAFVPALLVAITCGVCNAIVSTGNVGVQRDVNFNVGSGLFGDAGVPGLPPPPHAPQEPPDRPEQPPAPAQPPGPSRLPPPPLPPGPRK
jgi:hypothetical protein